MWMNCLLIKLETRIDVVQSKMKEVDDDKFCVSL